jgi:hypothetical protein
MYAFIIQVGYTGRLCASSANHSKADESYVWAGEKLAPRGPFPAAFLEVTSSISWSLKLRVTGL